MLLLEQFEHLTLHPKNTARLKALVLQLAVQGKLTEKWCRQNPDVAPAAELLKRIEAEKAQLVKEKKINKEKQLEVVSSNTIPFDIPEGWAWCRVGNLGFCQTGTTPSKNDPNNIGDFIPFIGPGDISASGIDYSEEGLSEIGLSKGRLIPKESILMVCIGGSIGKLAINEKDVSCNQQINTITPLVIPAKLVKYFLSSLYFQKAVIERATGSATPIINKGKWESIPIPLPPLAEQEAIVARVEELMQKIEELEQQTAERIKLKKNLSTAALQQLTTAPDGELQQNWLFLKQHFQSMFDETENVKKLRETILQLAVQGKLTTNWRKYNPATEPASELLKRIQAEKAQLVKDKKIKKEKPLEPISEDEVPYTLPEGWVWCRLEDLAAVGTGATPLTSNSEYYENGTVAWVTSSSTGRNYVYAADTLITETAIRETNCKVYPEGTLVVAMYGQGKTRGQITELKIEAATNQACAAIETWFLPEALKDYIKLYFKKIYEEIREAASGGAQPNLNLQKVKTTLIPLPSPSELSPLATKVDQLMQLCNELEQQIQQSKKETEALMQAVVQEALQVQEEVEL